MMTKKLLIVAGMVGIAAVVLVSCGTKRNPGRAYMPDMTYSRAYETYAPTTERLVNSGAEDDPFYNNRPVVGTIARGDMAEYLVPNDSAGYNVLSAGVTNPLDRSTVDLKEAARLFLINCAICHGAKLDGNGPLYKDGAGPYSAAPKNLLSDEIKQKADGTIFHVITYGKGQMGSYASQLNPKQRWMIVDYIRSKQGGGTDSTGAKASADSASGANTATGATNAATGATTVTPAAATPGIK